MRFKTTLILLGILAAAALFFLTLERPRHNRSLERAAREGRLAELEPLDVNRVTITRPDVTIDAERDGDRWRLLSPVEDRADDGVPGHPGYPPAMMLRILAAWPRMLFSRPVGPLP